MFYNGLSKKEVLRIYGYVIEKRKEGLGQRKIYNLVKQKFNKEINEGTISNWIFYNKKPFGYEETQFKLLKKPPKKELYNLYINKTLSAQKIAKIYGVSTITIINWLRYYRLPVRTHKQSMNTSLIKKELREKKLRRPTKQFSDLSPKKAYLLGSLCGDGHIRKKMLRFEIRHDKEFIDEFSNCLKRVYGLNFNPYYYKKRNSYILYVSSEIVCNDLLSYGKFGTFEWRIPKEIIKSKNEKIISNFLRGLYDSEGSCSRYCIQIVSVNKLGLRGVSILLRKLGIKNNLLLNKKGYYIINITHRENLKRFGDKIGFTIKRKIKNIEYLK